MRRTLAFVAVLIVLGAASAVGVAWLGAGVTSMSILGKPIMQWQHAGIGGSVERRSWNRVATTVEISQTHSSPLVRSGPNGPVAGALDSLLRSGTSITSYTVADFGWPFATLRSIVGPLTSYYLDPAELVITGVLIKPHSVEIGNATATPHPFGAPVDPANLALPTSVRIPGAILSAFTWTLIWSLLFFALPLAARLRDWRRHRRGLCTKCGHALAPRSAESQPILGRCAECGAIIREARPMVSRRRSRSQRSR